MDITQLLGYVGAFVVGLVLGLSGGGGSIITVPVMVYLIGINPVTATAYSLFVVGSTSAIGAFQNFKKQLNYRQSQTINANSTNQQVP